MKIIFMGTPDFSIPSFKILLESNHKVIAVVTQPDKERGRGQKVSFTAVKQFAVDNHIPVYQPEDIASPESIKHLKSLKANLFIVVAYGKILPKEVFDIPKLYHVCF